MRNIIIHYHIFKNAGTTFDWTLEKNFGNKALKFDKYDEPLATMMPHDLLIFLENHVDAISVSSHQLRFPIPCHSNFRFLPIIFFRNPLDRAFSIYSFYKRDSRKIEIVDIAKRSTFKQFIQYNLDSNSPYMNNFQTRFITKQDNFSFVDISDMFQAFTILNQLAIFGIVERMDESLVLYELELQKHFPIDLSYIAQNVSKDRYGSLNERIEYTRTEIGDELFDKLIDCNHLDFQLYEYVNKRLDAMIDEVNDFHSKLIDFKQRCARLQNNITA